MHEIYASIDALPELQNDLLVEVVAGGLNYHGWYVPTGPSQKYQIDVDGEVFTHPSLSQSDTSFIESNMIFCKAPNAPDSISQPGSLPEGAEWKTHFYYVRGENTQFPNGFAFTNSLGEEDYLTLRSFSFQSLNGFFYHPHYGRLYRVAACRSESKSNFVDLVILDCLPHDDPQDGIVLYIEEFFAAANTDYAAGILAICPGAGDKTAWLVSTGVVGVGTTTIYELRLSWSAGTITPELVQLPIDDLVNGFVGGKNGTPVGSGTVQDKGPKLNETSSGLQTCTSGLIKTVKSWAAAWTDPVDIDATVTREYDRIYVNTGDYNIIYCEGQLWYLHNRYKYTVTKTTGITYTLSGSITQSLDETACEVITSGLATWTKTVTVDWEVNQEDDYKARTFDGDISLCQAVRTYSGTYKYTTKSKAENSVSIGNDPSFSPTNDHHDQTNITLTGLLGSITLNGPSASYVGNNPNTSGDLYGSPLGASTSTSDKSFITPEPITNFDFHHSHLCEIGPFKLKNRNMGEQGLARTTTVVPDAPDLQGHYGYILSSGVSTGLAKPYTTVWTNAFIDGHSFNYDYYPFWADDLQEIKHRYNGSHEPTASADPTLPNNVLAIWL
jgi:hypothetical protein